jgi:hypothetical protein
MADVVFHRWRRKAQIYTKGLHPWRVGTLGGLGPLEGADPWRVGTLGGLGPLEGWNPWRVRTLGGCGPWCGPLEG